MNSSYRFIRTKIIDKVGCITLSRPENLNIIENTTFNEVQAVVDIFADDDNIRVVLINAECGISKTGKKVFSAGVNLKKYSAKFELANENIEKFRENLLNSRKLCKRIENLNKPVVIAVDGVVKGGFFEVALACDVILASEKAVFSLSEINVGLIPGYGGLGRLLKLVGKNRAFEIITSGRDILPEEAKSIGIITKLYTEVSFLQSTISYCQELSSKSPNAVKLIKQTINCLHNNEPLEKVEVDNFLKAVTHTDAKEGISAFLEKRFPDYN